MFTQITETGKLMTKILVTGATGNIASVTLPHLVESGADIRVLVRDETKAEALKNMGVEVVIGDLNQPDTLEPAFQNVDKVLLITPVSLLAADLVKNAIAAAKNTGNPHIVRLSSNVPEPVNETEVGRQCTIEESTLENSGLPYTIIRATFFMQNTMMAAQTVANDGMIYMPFGEGQLGMVDIRDVGAAIAKVLTSDGHENQTYVLTGPVSISLNNIASELSTVLGKDVTYMNVPLEAAKEAMTSQGMPDWMADMYNELFKNFSQNGANFVTNDVAMLTGHPATSYAQFAQDFAGVFGG